MSKFKPKLTADVKMQMEQQIKAYRFLFFSRPLAAERYQVSVLTGDSVWAEPVEGEESSNDNEIINKVIMAQ